jgi:nitroimidazol reductase NimA-like FMN-containing flavoprotein (pyridoxamine 5'-phosphate oxidase superfamily)
MAVSKFVIKYDLHTTSREKVMTSIDWLISFANKKPVLRLAVMEEDNTPHVTPLWFVFDGNAFYMATEQYRNGKVTKKVANIKKNNKVALVIDAYNPKNWDEVQGIMVQGTASLIQENSDEALYAIKLLKNKYPEYREKYSSWLDGKGPESKPIIIKVMPSKCIVWESP